MNKYFILVALIISAFFHAENDFDWRGISAGMKKEQVEEYTGCRRSCDMDKTDALIAIDARGFIFGSALAHTINKPLILARKENKLPGKLTKLNYGLEYGKDTLCIQDASVEPFSKFVIVDDLLATGGTAKCVIDLLRLKEKEVLALCIIIELAELKGAESIKIPVYSEIKY